MHDLLEAAAESMAKAKWAQLGCHSQGEAKGFFLNDFKRRLGLVAMREMARHRINRVHFVGMPRAVVDQIMSGRARAAANGRASAPQLDAFHGWQMGHMAPAAAAGA